MESLEGLRLGGLELDWGKFNLVRSHAALFQQQDRVGNGDPSKGRACTAVTFGRTLGTMVRRLELLGHTLRECETSYKESAAAVPSHSSSPALSYQQFAEMLRGVDAAKVIAVEEDHGDFDLGEFAATILADPVFTTAQPELGSLNADQGAFFENLDPNVALRLLAENPANLDLNVLWQVPEQVHDPAGELLGGASPDDRYLVVTEGPSDGAILRRSLALVAADIEDFFEFVDMSAKHPYPFTGTGNVLRFAQGLARIKVQNRILVVLDNDPAGRQAFDGIIELDLPSRVKVTLLPELEECRRVKTHGPSGTQYEDINGKAVSIEWFLNTALPGRPEPEVRWSPNNQKLGAHQGALIDKERYIRDFHDSVNRPGQRDWPKLKLLWNHLFAACTATRMVQ